MELILLIKFAIHPDDKEEPYQKNDGHNNRIT